MGTMFIFASRLQELKNQYGYTIKYICSSAGIDKSTYAKIMEHLSKDISSSSTINVLCKLSDFYEVSTDYLLGRI